MTRTLALCLAVVLVAACPATDQSRDEHANGHDGHSDTHSDEHDPHEDAGSRTVTLTPEALARIELRTAQVETRALFATRTTTGRVDFNQDLLAHVSPRVSGRVHSVKATLGTRVRAGQTLAVIDSIQLGQAKSDYLRARSRAEAARKTLDREEKLLADKITSAQSVLEARAAYEGAQAEFEAARQRLRLLGLSSRAIKATSFNDPAAAFFPLSAPIAGTVVEKHVSLGEAVSPDRHVFTVADLNRLWIWIDVYEKDLARTHLEDEVSVSFDAYAGRLFSGKVAYIRDEVDPDTRTARARIDIDNTEGLLRAGMFASVTITDPHGERDGASSLVVPRSAIQRDGKQHVLFVPVGDHEFEKRVVTIGRRTQTHAEILSGLTADDTVVTAGAFYLKSEAAKDELGGGHSH